MKQMPVSGHRRLFIGIMADLPVQQELHAYRRQWSWPPGARLTPPERMHLTLHFLGEVSEELLPGLISALEAIEPSSSIMHFGQGETWGPGNVVLRGQADAPLNSVRSRIGEAVQALGLPVERRPWTPHVTLARNARGAQQPSAVADIRWHIDHFDLVWSRPGPDSTYEVLFTRVRG